MFVTPAFATTAGATTGQASTLGAIIGYAPIVVIFIAFWFLLIRPQQSRVKALQRAVDAVKKGDQVVTGGGLMGKVTKVDDKFVEVELAQGMRVRAVKATLSGVLPAGGAKPAND